MASSAQDLATVAQTFSDEAQLIQTLIAQSAGGDVNSRAMLQTEIQNALSIRGMYLASVPDADPSVLDQAVQQARAFLGGGGVGSGTASLGGSVNLFGMQVPLIGIGIVAVLMFVAAKGRRA